MSPLLLTKPDYYCSLRTGDTPLPGRSESNTGDPEPCCVLPSWFPNHWEAELDGMDWGLRPQCESTCTNKALFKALCEMGDRTMAIELPRGSFSGAALGWRLAANGLRRARESERHGSVDPEGEPERLRASCGPNAPRYARSQQESSAHVALPSRLFFFLLSGFLTSLNGFETCRRANLQAGTCSKAGSSSSRATTHTRHRGQVSNRVWVKKKRRAELKGGRRALAMAGGGRGGSSGQESGFLRQLDCPHIGYGDGDSRCHRRPTACGSNQIREREGDGGRSRWPAP